jgi:hypothetical protein
MCFGIFNARRKRRRRSDIWAPQNSSPGAAVRFAYAIVSITENGWVPTAIGTDALTVLVAAVAALSLDDAAGAVAEESVVVGVSESVEVGVAAMDVVAVLTTELVAVSATELVAVGASELAAADEDAGVVVPFPLTPPCAPVAAMRASASAWVSQVREVPAEFTSGSAGRRCKLSYTHIQPRIETDGSPKHWRPLAH